MNGLVALLILTCAGPAVHAAPADTADTAEVRQLTERLKRVTLEADLLWRYIGSSLENPDIATLNRAARLLDQRRPARRR